MDVTYPEKYYKAAAYFDKVIGDVETTTRLDNERKLLFYALRRQAEEGPCTRSTPSLWHVTERYKHQAWCKLGKMSRSEAMVHFVRQFEAYLGGPVRWSEVARDVTTEEADRADDVAATRNAALASTEETAHTAHTVPQTSHSLILSMATGQLLKEPNAWDEDLRAHSAPTKDNIIYLVSQVMHARRLCKQAVLTRCQERDMNTNNNGNDSRAKVRAASQAEEVSSTKRVENASSTSQNVHITAREIASHTENKSVAAPSSAIDPSAATPVRQNVYVPTSEPCISDSAWARPPVRSPESNIATRVPKRQCGSSELAVKTRRPVVPIAFTIRPPRRPVFAEQTPMPASSHSPPAAVTRNSSLTLASALQTKGEKSWAMNII